MKATDKQIQEWKSKHGGVYMIPVDDKVIYLREPNITDWKRAFTAMQKNGEIGFTEEMVSALWLDGDAEVKTDDRYFVPLVKEMPTFFNYDDAIVIKEGSNYLITIGEATCKIRIITRDDLKIAERKNPSGKPFVTQENLFDMVVIEKDDAFADRNNAELRFPLYKAIEDLQKQKIASIKKL
ncbi:MULTISPECIES: hypothetical protein [Sphingobacterium]|uniref:hypothetical protein n=1 Tax=Sphingobacterium TaxID=28453 RepID=UPI00257DA751|nr:MULTISPECIES: hypothetical protein [Sphingobacterium]